MAARRRTRRRLARQRHGDLAILKEGLRQWSRRRRHWDDASKMCRTTRAREVKGLVMSLVDPRRVDDGPNRLPQRGRWALRRVGWFQLVAIIALVASACGATATTTPKARPASAATAPPTSFIGSTYLHGRISWSAELQGPPVGIPGVRWYWCLDGDLPGGLKS